jgi:hypothetical protein
METKLGTSKTVGNCFMIFENRGFFKSGKVGKEKRYLNHRLMETLENK